MLNLKNVTKVYGAGSQKVEALRGVSTVFRKNEFVAVLGPSGCGKTTLLNIIGGLDRYTDGDLVISGRSTKEFSARDWDTYRNHKVGFVFQSYNLIPHQTVLANVELALTLSGVKRSERRRRAKEALVKVGLGDQLRKKPNQMSGGQMQRVAIARALVNDPEILLADEPTGALDSETSLQVMDLLKEIAKDRLVIMVTHNPDLADAYASRIIRLLDGRVQSDSNPCSEEELLHEEKDLKKRRHPSMSFFTALSLSFNNLLTKKGRTLLTAFAGSIGIIGIALILSISSGVKNYIDRVQEDTLSSYPLEITEETADMSGMMATMMEEAAKAQREREDGKIYSGAVMSRMLNTMTGAVTRNNLHDFKDYIEDEANGVRDLVSDIQYDYDTTLYIYRTQENAPAVQVNPSLVLQNSGLVDGAGGMMSMLTENPMAQQSPMMQLDVFEELLDNEELLDQQFEVVTGRMPENYDELVVIVTENMEISDYSLYALGLRDQNEIAALTRSVMTGQKIEVTESEYTFDEIMNLSFRLLLPTDYYAEQEGGTYLDIRADQAALEEKIASALPLRVVGIIRPREDAVATSAGASGGIGYLSSLQEYAVDAVNNSYIVTMQKNDPDRDVLTGLLFESGEEMDAEAVLASMDLSQMPPEYAAFMAGKTPEETVALISQYMPDLLPKASENTLSGNLSAFGVSDLDRPAAIRIYPKDFDSKELLTDKISAYNEQVGDDNAIRYTDYVGLMMKSVTTIINAISYVLIAFVAISLVVSSIMIGIITYISVLERTKEIGILRAMGASKRDVSRVFNAETLIVGFAAGMIGIGVTLLCNILINVIIYDLTGIVTIAALPAGAGMVLVAISMLLTAVAGLIPSRVAAGKDPVVALRTE
ncbi:MAG: ABC transporter ATP-binding protein/permease [Clostridiales bacterium]|nr:ABC transporter ATP-binding protein/permease [Clostridiales bacterium]